MRVLLLVTFCFIPLAAATRAAEGEEKQEQLAAQKQALRENCLPVLKVELSQFQRICQLPPDELARAVDQGKQALNDFVDKHASPQPQGLLGGFRVLANGGNAAFVGGQQATVRRDSLEFSIRQRLTPLLNDAQKERFEQEIKEQSDFDRDAVVDFLMAILEQRLNLTDTQRGDVTAGLKEHWKANWDEQLALLPNYENYLPTLPSQAVIPHLDEDQRKIWLGLRQISFTAPFQMRAQITIDDIDLGE